MGCIDGQGKKTKAGIWKHIGYFSVHQSTKIHTPGQPQIHLSHFSTHQPSLFASSPHPPFLSPPAAVGPGPGEWSCAGPPDWGPRPPPASHRPKCSAPSTTTQTFRPAGPAWRDAPRLRSPGNRPWMLREAQLPLMVTAVACCLICWAFMCGFGRSCLQDGDCAGSSLQSAFRRSGRDFV